VVLAEYLFDFAGVWWCPFQGVVCGDLWLEEEGADQVDFVQGKCDVWVGLEEVFQCTVFFDGGEAFFGAVAFDAVVEVGAKHDGDVDQLLSRDAVGGESLVEAEEFGEDFDVGLFSWEFAAF